ncbi:putative RNA-directed DNA polymerase from transposon BS [Labeo rohita]|uniref:RNA-directed DNA polymerase from transposon BS n=1 Tax=Labeo rohita TaxID=84645 RepID=A0ABQ8L4B6_LABRO|nr:putative RNA-directed DNA polymerase from transposon BS [Labeo rohita]
MGHTLDLIISRGVTVSICEVLDFPVSDHSLIRFDIRAAPPAPTSTAPQRRRIITSSTVDDFVAAFTASDLCSAADLASPSCPDLFLSSFHTICSQIMDSVAPYKVMGTKSPSDPWLNDTTRALRRWCRQAECKWKKDRLQVSLEMFRDSLSTYQRAVKEAKGQYLSNLINSNSHRPGILFSTINSVINPVSVGMDDVSEHTCSAFKQYFLDKVLSVRQAITQVPAAVIPSQAVQCVLENFETVTLMDLKKAVHELKATICPLDAVPARIMKEAIDIVGPCLVSFINSCLSLGTVPTALKQAILMEKLVVSQLQSHLQLHAIADKFQSGFRSRHSTESALLRVHNDILGALDSKSSVVLVLLDLTAAFDTVDHAVLISRLQHIVGLQGMVLRWFSSYLTNRTFSVMLNDFSSSPAPLSSGVPQGSILGPILFSLYMLPLGQLISNYNVRFHFYADNLQIYLPVVLSNRKTEYILFTPDSPNSSPSFGPLTPQFALAVRNLGVIFDSGMIFGKQISAVVKASFYQLRLLSKVKPFLSRADLEKAVHAFISSRLDYCNALYTGLNQSLLNRLQLVQNAAARLLSNTSKRSHISPVLRSLHWLPVRFSVEFKILMFVFKAINGLAPVYLAELVVVYQPARTLRSSEHTALVMPKFNYKKFGGRSFAVQGPKLWNALPEQH